MKIPRSIKIGAHKVPVQKFQEKQEDPEAGTVRLGQFSSATGGHNIEIWDELQGSIRGEVFLHEIVEGINDIYGLHLDHRVLTTLSAALYQVLSENKLRFYKFPAGE